MKSGTFASLQSDAVDHLPEDSQADFEARFPQAAAVERLLRGFIRHQESGAEGPLMAAVDPIDVETALGCGDEKPDEPDADSKAKTLDWLHHTLAGLSGGNFDMYRELHAKLALLVARNGG